MSIDPPKTSNALSRGDRRWLAFLLAIVMASSTLVLPAYSALSRFLIEDFGLSRAQFGWLITSVTAVAALLSPSVGRIADYLGGQTMLLMLFIGSAVLMLWIAVAPTFQALLFASILAGFLTAAGNPGTNKLIVSYMPPGERGVIMGVKQSGVQIGTFLAGILLPGLSLALGWRSAIALIALIPAVAAFFVAHLKREAPAATTGSMGGAYRHPGVRWIALYAFLMGTGLASTVAFLPLYAQEQIGFEVTDAGFAMALVGFIGIGARILWSRWSETLGRFAPALRGIAGLSIPAISAIWAADYGEPWLLWIGAVVCGGSVVAWNGVANLGAVSLVEPQRAGHASGQVVMGFLGGSAVGPVLFGYSVETTGSYDLGWAAILVICAVAVGVMHAWDRGERKREKTIRIHRD